MLYLHDWHRSMESNHYLLVQSQARYRYARPVYGTGWGSRTTINGFGDRCSTVKLSPYMAGNAGYDPTAFRLTAGRSTN